MRSWRLLVLAGAVGGSALAACGDGPRPRASPRAPVPGDGPGLASLAEGSAYREVPLPPSATGRVVGRVTLRGAAVDPVYEAWPAMGTDVPTPAGRVVVGEGAALADVVVALRGLSEGKPWPAAWREDDRRVRLVAEAGRLRPFVSVVRVGTQLELENRLRADWVVHGYAGTGSGATRFNVSVGPGTTVADVAELWLDAPGVTFVTEDGRGAFHAYVVAVRHPYVDVTSAVPREDVRPGGFRIDGVPPGTYEVVAWHPGLGMQTVPRGGGGVRYVPAPPVERRARVGVVAGADAEVAFEFDLSDPAADPLR